MGSRIFGLKSYIYEASGESPLNSMQLLPLGLETSPFRINSAGMALLRPHGGAPVRGAIFMARGTRLQDPWPRDPSSGVGQPGPNCLIFSSPFFASSLDRNTADPLSIPTPRAAKLLCRAGKTRGVRCRAGWLTDFFPLEKSSPSLF